MPESINHDLRRVCLFSNTLLLVCLTFCGDLLRRQFGGFDYLKVSDRFFSVV